MSILYISLDMPRWHKTREITPDICLRHTDVNAIIRKRSRSFSMELVPEGGGGEGKKGLLLPAPEQAGDFWKGREEILSSSVRDVVRRFRNARLPFDSISRIDNAVKNGARREGGKEKFPACHSVALCNCVSLKTNLSAGAMATRSSPQISHADNRSAPEN